MPSVKASESIGGEHLSVSFYLPMVLAIVLIAFLFRKKIKAELGI